MGFFIGIYDPDTINACFGQHCEGANYQTGHHSSGSFQRIQLKQDWADLVDWFSWRKQPDGQRGILRTT